MANAQNFKLLVTAGGRGVSRVGLQDEGGKLMYTMQSGTPLQNQFAARFPALLSSPIFPAPSHHSRRQ